MSELNVHLFKNLKIGSVVHNNLVVHTNSPLFVLGYRKFLASTLSENIKYLEAGLHNMARSTYFEKS